jgi:isochorismate hydrolase
MSDPLDSILPLLTDVVLPNIKAVQSNQVEQIAANERLELAIDDLRVYMASKFAELAAQLTAVRAELAAAQAALQLAKAHAGMVAPGNKVVIH